MNKIDKQILDTTLSIQVHSSRVYGLRLERDEDLTLISGGKSYGKHCKEIYREGTS